jgi:hypothetical protein
MYGRGVGISDKSAPDETGEHTARSAEVNDLYSVGLVRSTGIAMFTKRHTYETWHRITVP